MVSKKCQFYLFSGGSHTKKSISLLLHISPTITLASVWAGRDNTGRLIRAESTGDMDQQMTPNRGGNLFNNTADPPPGPFYQNPGSNQNNNGGGLPQNPNQPQNPNLPQNHDANGPMPIPSPEDMYRMRMR